MKKVAILALAVAFTGGIALAGDPEGAGETTATEETPKVDVQAEKAAKTETKKAEKKNMNPAAAVPKLKMHKAESGLEWQDIKVGTGESPVAEKNVVVHYTGWLKDGKKFDSSKDRNEPFSFQIGVGQVIKGWDEGVMSMKKGGVRKLFIPPTLGYGDRDVGGGLIPANSTLVFEVELIDIK